MCSGQLILKKETTVQTRGWNQFLSSLFTKMYHSFILFSEEDAFLENIPSEGMNELLSSCSNEIYTLV